MDLRGSLHILEGLFLWPSAFGGAQTKLLNLRLEKGGGAPSPSFSWGGGGGGGPQRLPF